MSIHTHGSTTTYGKKHSGEQVSEVAAKMAGYVDSQIKISQ
jgi:hypothetical protein